MAVVPIRIVGDPVLHTATEPVPVADDGSLPADLADLIKDLYDTMDAANGVGLGREPDRRVQAGVRLRLRRRARAARRGGVESSSIPSWKRPRCPRRCRIPTTTTRAACRSPANRSRRAGPSWARVTGLDADGTPITLEGTDLFARMLQHETGHLDGFLYLDRLVGRHARSAKRAVKSHGWGVPGLTWTPGKDPDPFGH